MTSVSTPGQLPGKSLSEISNNVGSVKSFFCSFLKFFVTFVLFRAHNHVHSEEWSSSSLV